MELSEFVEVGTIKWRECERVITLTALVSSPSFPQTLLHFKFFGDSFPVASSVMARTASSADPNNSLSWDNDVLRHCKL